MSEGDDPKHAWGALEAKDVRDLLGVDPTSGLSSDTIRERQAEFGPNRVERVKSEPAWRTMLDQFSNALILLLLGASVVAGLVGAVRDAIVIVSVLSLNAVIGFVQERRAQSSMEELQEMLRFSATVRRDGELRSIDSAELVPGDIVSLETGDRVPCDARVVEAEGLGVDESTLTGESELVEKSSEPVERDAPLAERSSEVFLGTSVGRGTATLVATRTGMDTEMGRISSRMGESESRESPLEKHLAGLAVKLSLVAIAAAAAVVGMGLLRGDPLDTALVDGVVLAVASIPEGLPAIVTVTLALGMRAMAKEGALVEDLRAIHTLGATTVVCTDKTGTLTRNEMRVRVVADADHRIEIPDGDRSSGGSLDRDDSDRDDATGPQPAWPLVRIAALCNEAELGEDPTGDPTEIALLRFVEDLGVDRDAMIQSHPRVAEIPFTSDRMYMATFHGSHDEEGSSPNGGVEILVKGAPEVLLERCAEIDRDGERTPIDENDRKAIEERIEELTETGHRVLMLARTDTSSRPDDVEDAERQIRDLIYEGLVAMEDPPRPRAADTVEQFARAGIAVKMVTGDNARTSEAIAERLGIEGPSASGDEIADRDAADVGDRLDQVGVLARVEPAHKVDVVDALAEQGHVVAMTGDGVNDAAALRRAHVGVAMGARGTEVAKEAGDVVLTDDRLETILTAIERGRTIYDNIITFVRFNLATNLGAMLTILVAKAAGLPTPFTPLQVLWVNLIMDGPPAMALGADPPADDVMDRPPRDPDAPILTKQRLSAVAAMGIWMAATTLAVFWYGRSSADDDLGVAMAFTTFVLLQVINAINVRVGWTSVFSRRTLTNRLLWLALGTVALLQVLVVQVRTLGGPFDTEPLTAMQWLICIAAASSLLAASEAVRLLRRYRTIDTAELTDQTASDGIRS